MTGLQHNAITDTALDANPIKCIVVVQRHAQTQNYKRRKKGCSNSEANIIKSMPNMN